MKPFHYTLVLLALGVSTATRVQKVHDPHAFLTVWETTTLNESITIPTTGGGYDYTIDWGDGTVEHHQTGDATHPYTTPGRHPVAITGKFPRIYFNADDHTRKSRKPNAKFFFEVQQWGTQKWTSMARAFSGCSYLEITARDNPDLSAVESMGSMFFQAASFNQDISGWNVSKVKDMTSMFWRASAFNQPLNRWNVSKVKTMHSMFREASAFDQSLNRWNVSNVTSMEGMFMGASSFNHPLDS